MCSFYQRIRENFIKRIESKNSWGKNEVLIQFDNAVFDALTDNILDLNYSDNDTLLIGIRQTDNKTIKEVAKALINSKYGDKIK